MNPHAKLARRAVIGAASALALSFSIGAPAAAQVVTLKAVGGLPSTHIFMSNFKTFVDKFNADNTGVVQIKIVGGPEVTPGRKQGQALRRGAFDIVYGPAAYYAGIVPEASALNASNITPAEARANGGMDLINQAWKKRLNARFLGWLATSVHYNLYFREKPERLADGSLSLKGKKIRGNPLYKPLIESLGGTLVSIPSTEVQTALQRGLVDGLGWVTVSWADQGWSKFIKYRLATEVFTVNLSLIINNDKFESLSKKAQDALVTAGIQHEKDTAAAMARESAAQAKLAESKGIKTVTMGDAARKKYLANAYNAMWARVKKRAPDTTDALKAKMMK